MISYSLLAASALLSPALALAYVYQPDYDAQQPHQLVFPPPPSVENSHPPSLDYVDTNHLYDADTGRETYEGWSVHRLDIANDKVRAEMIQTAEYLRLDIWAHQKDSLDLLLPPSFRGVEHLSDWASGMLPSLKLNNLFPTSVPFIPASTFSTLLADTYSSPPSPFALPDHPTDPLSPLSLNATHPLPPSQHPFHHAFRSVDDINRFLSLLKDSYPDLVTLENIGTSAEGRLIPSIRIGIPAASHEESLGKKNKGGKKGKKGKKGGKHKEENEEKRAKVKRDYVIVGGQHAREWIATSTSLYYAHFLLAHSNKQEIRHLLTYLDFFIVPVLNVDGYEFSHTTSRLWRKNRQVVDEASGCVGVDLNRNWGFQWSNSFSFALDTALGPCSESYPGTSAFSSPESAALSSYLLSPSSSNTTRLPPIAFLDLHAYGQLLMYPFSFSCSAFPPDAEDLDEAALGTTKAILHSTIGHHHNGGSHGPGHGGGEGSKYKVGEACQLAFRAAGDSTDWGYGDREEGGLGVKWSFSLEAPDTGTYGFLMPPSSIVPVGEETTQGLLYLAQFILKKGI